MQEPSARGNGISGAGHKPKHPSAHKWSPAQHKHFRETMRKKYGAPTRKAGEQVVRRALLRRIKRLAVQRIAESGDVGDFELSVLGLVNMLLGEGE